MLTVVGGCNDIGTLDDERWMRVEFDGRNAKDRGSKKVKEERTGRGKREEGGWTREGKRRGSKCPCHGASQSGSPNVLDIVFFLSALLFPTHSQVLVI